jgi:glutamyl-tRNA synthetase
LANVLDDSRFQDITFYHHPLITEDGDKKLSKSAGSTSIKYLREKGKTARDVYRMIGSILGTAKPLQRFEDVADALL